METQESGQANPKYMPVQFRAYNERGLPFYKVGKSFFVNYAELEDFIRQNNELKNVPAGHL